MNVVPEGQSEAVQQKPVGEQANMEEESKETADDTLNKGEPGAQGSGEVSSNLSDVIGDNPEKSSTSQSLSQPAESTTPTVSQDAEDGTAAKQDTKKARCLICRRNNHLTKHCKQRKFWQAYCEKSFSGQGAPPFAEDTEPMLWEENDYTSNGVKKQRCKICRRKDHMTQHCLKQQRNFWSGIYGNSSNPSQLTQSPQLMPSQYAWEQNKLPKRPRCQKCRRKDHPTEICLRKEERKRPFCVYCKKVGHDIESCKKRQQVMMTRGFPKNRRFGRPFRRGGQSFRGQGAASWGNQGYLIDYQG